MNKKKLMLFGLPILCLVLVSAGLIQYFGQVQRDVTVEQSIDFIGENAAYVTVAGGENVTSNDLKVKSKTSVLVPLSILTTPDWTGITHTVNYLLDNFGGVCSGDSSICEKRIFISAEDAGVTNLDSFNSMSWDANVVSGYLPHVDVFLENGEVLVFEYAKASNVNCDTTLGPYPTGEISTFGVVKGEVISDTTYAWLNGPTPGPCGLQAFDDNHKTLTNWKAVRGSEKIIGFEIEVDNWISPSNSKIKNILINGNSVDVTLKPSDSLAFNVETEFAIDIVPSTYTLTTTVDLR